jgi:hypothetical protein
MDTKEEHQKESKNPIREKASQEWTILSLEKKKNISWGHES